MKPEQQSRMKVVANILAMGGAHANSMFVAAADRIGVERGQPFLGNSLIVSHIGWPLAGPASLDREEMLVAEQSQLDRFQRKAARPPHGHVRRNAWLRGNARLLIVS